MNKKLKIMAPIRYPWKFNGPSQSKHDISIRYFLPLNKISKHIEGITVFNPLPRFDLIHAFNRIPVGIAPYIIGFESHLPRAYGLEETTYYRMLENTLAGKRCRGIIAISEYARRQFLKQHKNSPRYEELREKLIVRYPNTPIPAAQDAFVFHPGEPVRLVFIGNHFGRKGGPVSVRLAALARQRNFSVQVDIVSSLDVGSASWTDPLRPGFFDKDFQLLRSLPNLKHHGSLPNKDVLELIRKAHFVLLPTFSDSFGYSAIEAMAQYTPVVATRQGALPEFIEDGVNGILLDLENDEVGEWKHILADRSLPSYETFFGSEIDRLAMEAYQKIESLMKNPSAYSAMRKAARATAEKFFSSEEANLFWDNYYCEALAR